MHDWFRSGALMISLGGVFGCGSSTEEISDSVTHPRQVEQTMSAVMLEHSTSVVARESEGETTVPASALEVANAPTKTFHRDEQTGIATVSFADLNLKELLKVETLTESDLERIPLWLKALNGTRIRTRGHMFPQFEDTGIEQFVLDCSSGGTNLLPNANLWELVQVELTPGVTTDAIPYSKDIDVIGTFRIAPIIEDGKFYRLYLLEHAFVVIPEPKSHQRKTP